MLSYSNKMPRNWPFNPLCGYYSGGCDVNSPRQFLFLPAIVHRKTTTLCYVYLNKQVYYIDGLVQDCSNSIANALELLQSCTKPSIYDFCLHGCFLFVGAFFHWSLVMPYVHLVITDCSAPSHYLIRFWLATEHTFQNHTSMGLNSKDTQFRLRK